MLRRKKSFLHFVFFLNIKIWGRQKLKRKKRFKKQKNRRFKNVKILLLKEAFSKLYVLLIKNECF